MSAQVNETADWVKDVHAFWFGELSRKDWFVSSEAVDRAIHDRFLGTYEFAAAAPLGELIVTPATARSAIIVLDQFPRNLFRDDARAFATDAKAKEVAEHVIAIQADAELSPDERAFIYLPFEHSESIEDQRRSVELMKLTGNAEYVAFAEKHLDVIQKFGRFPHRNASLGRVSTPDEQAFLTDHGRGF